MSPYISFLLPLYIPLILARPNPTPTKIIARLVEGTRDPAVPTSASAIDPTALLADFADFSSPANASAIYASQTKAYAADISQYFRTASSAARASLSDELAAESSWEAAFDKAATYTGTSD